MELGALAALGEPEALEELVALVELDRAGLLGQRELLLIRPSLYILHNQPLMAQYQRALRIVVGFPTGKT